MQNRTCSVETCERPPWARGLCAAHYQRLRKTGDVKPDVPHRAEINLTGQRFGRLTVISGIPLAPGQRRQWSCVCDCGTPVVALSESMTAGRTSSCGCLNRERTKEALRREVVSYTSAHKRVRAMKGKPSSYPCVDCGQQAREWSYDHSDPDALHGAGNGKTAYSLNPARYQPRCTVCHRAFDRT